MNIDKNALDKTLVALKEHLLRSRVPQGSWQGKLSSSALSTATAVFALATVDKKKYKSLIFKGLDWLKDNCNADGGWGDTPHQLSGGNECNQSFGHKYRYGYNWCGASPSNISTTLLCWSAFAIADGPHRYDETVAKAESWLINFAGSLEPKTLARAINQQYGQDRSFSAPILTMCTLAGRLGESKQAWRWIKPLPFELATCPHWLFKWLKLPVVSYALPALIAVGQANYYHRRPKNPVVKLLRYLTRRKTLTVLRNIQPESGGFLEAIPLTAFVVMSLAASGQRDNDVTVKGTEFLIASVREDGSWPIDTNLATWVTTLSINALAAGQNLENALSLDERANLQQWLLSLQYCQEHPYTHAAGGGWAWTNLPGAVPDADDTAGALIAL
ncbi:MAG: prenyltransferase/squalene oxidase repeat-containing protein, partial [Sedimentisphaerales bacterium]